MFKATKDANHLLYKEDLQDIKNQAKVLSFENLERIMNSFATVKSRLKANVNFDVAIELLLINLNG